MGQLSTEQVLLLNNLMYMKRTAPFTDISAYEGRTVGDLVRDIDVNQFKSNTEYTTYTNGDEWRDIISAIQSDDTLCNTRIESCYQGTDEGKSVLFSNPSDNEAIVVFQGTVSGQEWKDNFQGGAGTDRPDGVSTRGQEKALEWFQSQNLDGYDSVTVSGHSKGGNKAKYVTVMDDSVDRCLSFDGQGFSDEFIAKYQDRIADNQYKIHNHNTSGDYVNILLNDIGEKTYYKGYNYGKGKFLENHCPNTFFKFNKDGSYELIETGQNKDVQNLDEFLNNYLRSIPEKDRQQTLELIGDMVQQSNIEGSTYKDLLNIFFDGSNSDRGADLIAYFIKYEQQNPELAQSIRNVLDDMGYGEYIRYVDIVEDIMDSKYFDKLLDGVDWIGGKLPDWLVKKIATLIKDKWGVELTPEQIRMLLKMIHNVNTKMDSIVIRNNGADRKVKDTVSMASGNFEVVPDILSSSSELLNSQSQIFAEIADTISSVNSGLGISFITLRPMIKMQEEQVKKCGKACEQLGKALEEISQKYTVTEKNNVGKMNL